MPNWVPVRKVDMSEDGVQACTARLEDTSADRVILSNAQT